jgi:hypothetical protein
MIKFFRHIRRRLISENPTSETRQSNKLDKPVSRFGRYLVYSIGEIILVVIGILIALSINNWNEDRKDLDQSVFYHEQLINDLDLVIASLDRDTSWAKMVEIEINRTIRILDQGEANDSTLKILDFALGNYFRLNRQLPELTSYEEMKSSGQLNLIYNKSVRNELALYQRNHNNIANIYAELNSKVNQSEFLDSYVKFEEKGTVMTPQFTYDFPALASDKIVMNTFSRYAFHWETKYSFASRLKGDAENLRSIIQEELNELKK